MVRGREQYSRIAALHDQLEINRAIVKSTPNIASLGAPFRTQEFQEATRYGVLANLAADVRSVVTSAYVAMERVNHLVSGALNSSHPSGRIDQSNQAWLALRDTSPLIDKAFHALSRSRESQNQ